MPHVPAPRATAGWPRHLLTGLVATALLSLALRLWLAWKLPVTGDEAFFYWWGVHLDWGYYDHPPMVGWLIGAMRALFGDTLPAIRLPIVLLPLLVGGLLGWGLAAIDRERAAWAVLFFWLAPINWLGILITTDTPLILWSLLAVAALLRAERRPALDGRAWALYALAGVAFGGAFLSKYFAVVLAFAVLVYFALFRRERWSALLAMAVCALPGPAINIAWNIDHGWSNVMFNVYNRNEGEAFEWSKPLTYVAMLAYLATPSALWLGWRHRTALAATLRAQRWLACLLLLPFGFFALLSLKKVIGLHWVLAFYPFVFVWLALALPADKLRGMALGMAAFAALHVAAVVGVAVTSLEQWRGAKIYPQIVRSVRTAEILRAFEAPGAALMANAYTPASIYGFERRAYMPVFGRGRFHARQDDLLVDFSVYDGRTLRVLTGDDAPKLAAYAPYFESVRAIEHLQDGVRFHAVEGRGFRYEAYRRGVLADIHARFYDIPSWLPMTGCPFCERLCGAVRCENPSPR
mgnify:CR=1 FL=1